MVLKGPRVRVSPVRTYVVVGSLVVAVSLVAGASSPSSDLVGTNVLLLIPRLDIGTCSLVSPPSAFFYWCQISSQLPVGDDVFVLLLPFQGLVLLVSAYPTCQDQRYYTLVEDSGDFFQPSYVA